MKTTDVVCLCDYFDMKALFDGYFAQENPWLNLLKPDEVTHPEAVRHALAFRPGPDAFSPYVNLELVSSVGAGVDTFLDNPSLRPDVAVSRIIIPEQANTMASFAIWFITGWHRKMWDYAKQQANQSWQVIYPEPAGEFTVGILGHGQLGKRLSQLLRSLGYSVIAFGSAARMDGEVEVLGGSSGLAELAGRSKAIVNLLPLTEQTRGILSAGFFAHTSSDVALIQLGRGAHLVEQDLIEALDEGRLGMAALDVFAEEPLPAEHPFWRHEKIQITPHVAGDSEFGAFAKWIAEGIIRFDAGDSPLGLVDRSRGY